MDLRRGKVAIAGGGLMGAEIAADYSLGGFPVAIWCRTNSTAQAASRRARAALLYLAHGGVVEPSRAAAAADRLVVTTSLEEACEDAIVVVESVIEEVGAKVDVLGRVGSFATEAVIASNTSSLSISELGAAARIGSRFLGTHYWNPPTLMPLVEVIAGSETDEAVATALTELLRRTGKQPVAVPDIAGFVWNRLQFALLREALALVQREGVDPATIDVVVREGLARRWSALGPFEVVALGGADTFAAVARQLFPRLATAEVDPELFPRTRISRATTRSLLRRRNEWLTAFLRSDVAPDASDPVAT